MNFIKVKWNHTNSSDPVWLYSEIDNERWEVRKVEVFPDGKMGFADKYRSFGTTELGKEPLPEMADIAADPQFEPVQILKPEFDDVWLTAIN